MPELEFRISGAEPVTRGLMPLLRFRLEMTQRPPAAAIQALILQAQIQIQCPQRSYTSTEKERLSELFGPPERWGQTLRNRLWTHAVATVGSFSERTEALLPVPCSYDLNLATTKYLYALEDGDIPLLFLLSGSIFYVSSDGRLQVQPIAWDKECVYRMPVRDWQQLMEHHYPQSAWLYLQRDTFERLYQYKRVQGLATWEQTLARLLETQGTTRRPQAAEAIAAAVPGSGTGGTSASRLAEWGERAGEEVTQ